VDGENLAEIYVIEIEIFSLFWGRQGHEKKGVKNGAQLH
jgi:hypothetical protein